jgi:hypothetical protein
MVEHSAARADRLPAAVRGGVHQVAYARAIEHLTGAKLMAISEPTHPDREDPESRPHIERGEHTKLYRFSKEDFQEVAAVWNGSHPETGDELIVADVPHPEGIPAHDLPPQPAVFAPGYSLEEITEIAQRLRKQAGLPDKPTGVVSRSRRGSSRTSSAGSLWRPVDSKNQGSALVTGRASSAVGSCDHEDAGRALGRAARRARQGHRGDAAAEARRRGRDAEPPISSSRTAHADPARAAGSKFERGLAFGRKELSR